ncbi:hypothetical protein FACS1894216_00960 [Synergistales bacterium]|nr:hypothetical protein FACS1894216_00960 [Synergistales bacterium]
MTTDDKICGKCRYRDSDLICTNEIAKDFGERVHWQCVCEYFYERKSTGTRRCFKMALTMTDEQYHELWDFIQGEWRGEQVEITVSIPKVIAELFEISIAEAGEDFVYSMALAYFLTYEEEKARLPTTS